MGSSEVLENGAARNDNGIKSCGEDDREGMTNGSFEQMVNGSKENENLGDEILEDFDTYWEDVNDRLMVSRMVSDSVIKGIVSAVEQEAAERLVAKETELAKLKEYLQFHDGGLSKTESLGSPMSQDELESMNFREHMTLSDVFMEHGKMGDFLDELRSSAKDEFKKLKKSIDEFRGSKSIRNISSRSEMVGLEGILQEKESGIWVRLDKTVNNLKMMVDTVFKQMDDMLQLSKTSLGQWQEEHLTQVEIEAMVMRSVIRTVQEDFEYKLWDQYAKLCGERNEKLNDISNLRTELDAVLKSLSSSETGYMTSHGSHDADVFTRKTSSEHVTSSTWDGNEKMEDSKTDITENFDDATLKHMSKEEMVTYFNNIMTMMKRHHESILQKRTNEYFHLRADYLKLRGGSAVPHKKDKGESDILRKKIPEIIFKLDDILVENEKHPAFTQETLSFGNLKDRLDSLLSENHQLRNLLKHKQVEDKSLLSQVSDANEKRLDSLLSENHQLRNLLKDAQVEVKSPLSQVSDTNEKRLDSLLSENHQLRDLLEDTQVEVKSLLSQVSDADEKRLDSFLSENHQLRDLLKDTQVEVKSLLSQVSDADEKRLDSLISENRQLRDLLKDTQVEVKSLLSQVSYADEKRLDCLISENRQLRDLLKDTQVEVKSLLSQVSDADEKRLDSLISENHQLRDLLKDTQVEVKSLLSQVSDADEKRLDSLLSENHQLRDSLKDTQVEVKSLLFQVSDANEKRLQYSLVEADMLKQIGDLNLAMEDSLIEASVREEVYTCFLRDLSGGTRNEAEELNLGFELLNDSNDTDAESTKFEIEDLEIECLILQEICGVISGEGIKEAKDMLKELYSEYLNEKDIRISLDTKVIEMENKLKFEVEEKDRLKQLVSELEICVTEKENLATEGSAALAKKMGQFEQVLQELNAVKEFASQQQTLASGCNKEVNVVKGQLAEALAQIEVLKEEAAQLNKSLEEKEEELKEANDSEEKKGFSPKKKKKQICNLGSCNKLFKKNAEGK